MKDKLSGRTKLFALFGIFTLVALGAAFGGPVIRFGTSKGRSVAPVSTAIRAPWAPDPKSVPQLGQRRRSPLGPFERPRLNLQVGNTLTRSRLLPIQNINLTPNAPGDEVDPVLSPDGRTILFASTGRDANADGKIDGVRPDQTFHIWMMDADGTNQRQITTDKGNQVEPAWSPNGNAIAYASDEGGDFDIYVYTLPAGPKVKLSLGASNERWPTWSPGGDRVAFMSDSQGSSKIWSIKIDGTAPQMLTTGPSDDMNPAWSPDGQHIAFESNGLDTNNDGVIDATGPTTNIWVMSPGGTQQRQMTARQAPYGGGFMNVDPSWTKDGVYLVFASDRLDTNGDGIPDAHGPYDAYALPYSQPESTSASAATLLTPRPTTVANPLTGNVRHPTVFPDLNLNPKVVYANDQSGNEDLWMTSISDYSPPDLVELPTVTPRQSAPGATVTITAHVSDQESGVKAVYAQIRDPDDASTDALGQDHKCYYVQPGTPNAASGQINVWSEIDAQMVNAQNYRYEIPPYIPPVDDYYLPMAPSPGWIQLYDDGQHGDGAAGDGIYGNTWQTPTNAPSDFYLDIITYDNASHWKIYDGVWGFTTQQFASQHNMLLVMDYAEGQKFMKGERNGLYTFTDYYPTYFPVESYFTHNPTGYGFFPGTYLNNVINAPPGTEPAPNSLGVVDTFRQGTDVEGYDLWRVLCRGRVPSSVIDTYAPRTVQQPNFQNPGTGAPQNVSVADKGIFWVSPYAGDLWVGDGTILDANTQSDLTSFLDKGGRLTMTGQDIAWALTRGGAAASTPLLTKMGVQYVDDAGIDTIILNAVYMTNRRTLPGNGVALDPITVEPWGAHSDEDTATVLSPDPMHMPQTYWPTMTTNPGTGMPIPAISIAYRTGATGDQPYTDAAGNQFWMDSITPIAPAIMQYGYNPNQGVTGINTGIAAVRSEDLTTKARSLFMAFGMEGLGNNFVAAHGQFTTAHSHNLRHQLAHNAICWGRTGAFYGVVQLSDSLAPKKGVLIRAIDDWFSPGTVMGTAYTQADGTYLIEGLPSSIYRIEAYMPGYAYDKAHRDSVHGGGRTQVNIKISEAPPGSISGKVTGPDGTTPIASATVTASLITTTGVDPSEKSVQTDQYGNYSITTLAAGDYTVKSVADGYPDRTYPRNVTVVAATDTPSIDFAMGGAAGSIVGTVTRDSDNSAVSGATLELRAGTAAIQQTTTDTAGAFAFTNVAPGTYTIAVTAGPNILPTTQQATLTGNNQLKVTVVARTTGATFIAGTVRDSNGNAVTGATIQALLNGQVAVTTTSTGTQQDGPNLYNYKLNALAAGTYDIVASKAGLQSTTTRVAVTAGQQLYTLDLTLDALHVFSAGLSMVSTPYNYSASDPATLLGTAAAATHLATWVNASSGYAYYPQAPADKIRPSVGYFVQLDAASALNVAGTPVDTSQLYAIHLLPGWNMIGNPFPFIVNWFDASVRQGTQTMTLQDAIAAGLVKNALWTYGNGQYTLAFQLLPWQGYWVKATQDLTLLVPNVAGRSASPDPYRSRAVTDDSWFLQLAATTGKLRDASNYLGVSRQAQDGYDPTGDVPEAPPAATPDYIQLTFPHRTGWAGESGDYAVDTRAPVAGDKTWEFEVRTNQANADVTVNWPNIGQLPKRYTAVLEDMDAGTSRYLRSLGGYTYRTGAAGGTRHFRIRVTTQGQARLVVSNLQVIPNRAQGGAVLSFNLSDPASVRVRIMSTTGRTVRELVAGQARSAGINNVPWDGRDSRGVALGYGLYIYEVEAQAEDGRTVVQPRPFLYVR